MNVKNKEEKTRKPYDHLEDVHTNSGSATECTGLITRTNLTDEEFRSYYDLYDFGPPIVKEVTHHELGKK